MFLNYRFFLFLCAVTATVCSWLALNECEFFTLRVGTIDTTDNNIPPVALLPSPFENAIEVNIGLLRYEIILQEEPLEEAEAFSTTIENSINNNISSTNETQNDDDKNDNNRQLLLRISDIGQCTDYPADTPYMQFDSSYVTVAQSFGMIGFVFGCCAIVSALAEASFCYHPLSKYPIIFVFLLATVSQALTFLIFKEDTFCNENNQDCDYSMGRGFIFSLSASILYFVSMLIEAFGPRVDPFLLRRRSKRRNSRDDNNDNQDYKERPKSRSNTTHHDDDDDDVEEEMGAEDGSRHQNHQNNDNWTVGSNDVL